MNIRSVKLSHRLGKRESEETETNNIVVNDYSTNLASTVSTQPARIPLKQHFPVL